MKYNLIINDTIFNHQNNSNYPKKTKIKKYNCYIELDNKKLYKGDTIQEYFEEIKNHFENNTIETIFKGIEIVQSKKIAKEQIEIYRSIDIENIESIIFDFEENEHNNESLLYIKFKKYTNMKCIQRIVFEKLN